MSTGIGCVPKRQFYLDKLPEAAYLTGDFSKLPGKIITDPSNGQ